MPVRSCPSAVICPEVARSSPPISISSEEPEKVEEFLDRKKGDTTYREITSAYRLATDPDRSVNDDYMRAAGQNGIPTAFLERQNGDWSDGKRIVRFFLRHGGEGAVAGAEDGIVA